MAETLMQRLIEALPFLDDIAEDVQPKVQEAVDAGGTTARNVLDGVWFEAPLHPALTDVPVGCWTAALVFDGLDVATGKEPVRHAADASLVLGTLGALGATVTGSDREESSYLARVREAGIEPAIGHAAANVPEGDAHNTELEARYAGRIRRPA